MRKACLRAEKVRLNLQTAPIRLDPDTIDDEVATVGERVRRDKAGLVGRMQPEVPDLHIPVVVHREISPAGSEAKLVHGVCEMPERSLCSRRNAE